MRIGVDGGCWSNRRGFGRFTRGTMEALTRLVADQHELVLLVDRPTLVADDLPPLPNGVIVQAVDVTAAPSAAAAAEGSRSVRDVLAMTRAARRARTDVFWFPASYSWFPVPGTPAVVTLHDVIAETLPDLVLPTRGDRVRWRLKQELALRSAVALVTVSEASRRAIVQHLHVDPDRLHVIREAADKQFTPTLPAQRDSVLRRYGLTGTPYLLYVGGISPHKNLRVLIDALSLCTTPDLRLVLVGDTDNDPFLSSAGSVRAAAAAGPDSSRIIFMGYVPDADLPALYGGAVATAQPSLSEGFGLTAAESAACGTPVLASEDPALRELLGPAGRYAAACDSAAWAQAIDVLAQQGALREQAAKACLELSAAWSWDATARDLLPILLGAGDPGG